jgi:hypothetical protein
LLKIATYGNLQVKQQGFIGFILLIFGFVPLTNTSEIAAQRAQDFYIAWYVTFWLWYLSQKYVGSM